MRASRATRRLHRRAAWAIFSGLEILMMGGPVLPIAVSERP